MFGWLNKNVDDLDGKDLVEISCVAATIWIPAFALPIWAAYGVVKSAKPTAKAIAATARGTSKLINGMKPKPLPPPKPKPKTKLDLAKDVRDRYLDNMRVAELLPEGPTRDAAMLQAESTYLKQMDRFLS